MYLEEMFKVLDESLRLLTPNGKMCINIQPLPVSKEVSGSDRSSVVDAMTDVNLHLRNIGMELSNIIIWDKRKYNNQQIFGSYPYPPNLYSHISFEYIYVFRKKGGSRAIN